jgi:hypothetical protein
VPAGRMSIARLIFVGLVTNPLVVAPTAGLVYNLVFGHGLNQAVSLQFTYIGRECTRLRRSC